MLAYLAVPLIFLAAGFLQGLSGFGSALIAMPLLAFFIDIKTAVATCTLCGMIINMRMTMNLSGHLDREKIVPLMVGCVPGVVFGTIMLREVDGHVITLLLGILVSSYAVYSLLVRPMVLKLNPKWGMLAGFMTGAITSAASAGGPPTIIYSTLMGWQKNDFKATLSAFFLMAATLSAIGHLVGGLTTFYVFKLFLLSLPLVLLGVYLGHRLAGRVSEEAYKKVVMLLLVFMGIMLILNGLG